MPFTRSKRVRVGTIDIHVAEAGPDQGRELVFLHGNPDSHAVWTDVCDRLSGAYRCIAPDLPGYGASDEDLGGLTLEDQGGFVARLLDALGLDRVDLIVHDVGGPYGLAFAALHPERLRSLTIFNTIFSPSYRWHFWARVWRRRGVGEAAMAIANRPLFVSELRRGSPRITREYARHVYEGFTAKTKRTVLRWYRAMDPEVFTGWDERLRAATRAVPKAVIWGDRDPYIPPPNAEVFGVPAPAVHHLSECGHWTMIEEPARCALVIEQLIGSAPAT